MRLEVKHLILCPSPAANTIPRRLQSLKAEADAAIKAAHPLAVRNRRGDPRLTTLGAARGAIIRQAN